MANQYTAQPERVLRRRARAKSPTGAPSNCGAGNQQIQRIVASNTDVRHGARYRNWKPWFYALDNAQDFSDMCEGSFGEDEVGMFYKQGDRRVYLDASGRVQTGANVQLGDVTHATAPTVQAANVEYRHGASVFGFIPAFVSINDATKYQRVPEMSLFYDEQGLVQKRHGERVRFATFTD